MAFVELGNAYLSEIDSTPVPVNQKFLQSILRRQGELDRWLLLIKCGDDPIGFVHAKVDRDERPGWGYILEFYIVPDRRRTGWGRELFNHTAGALRARGIAQVWLESSLEALAFWCSLSFAVAGGEARHPTLVGTI